MIYTLTLNPSLDREMTIDEFAFDRVLRAGSVRVDYGGKGLNVSRALRALGVASTALGFIGGSTGEILNAGLEALGIATDFIRVDGETRTNISIVNGHHTHYLKVNAVGPEIEPAEQSALRRQITRLAHEGDGWVLAGSLPLGVPSSTYADLIQTIQTAGAYAILDTDHEALRLGCGAGPFLVKPNAREASQLVGARIDAVSEAAVAVHAILGLGPRQVIISLGRDGAIFSDGQVIWSATPPAIEERNPIGAGDALVAGLILGLQQHVALADRLRLAVACGAVAASLDGTAMGTREQVEDLAARVQINSVASRAKPETEGIL